MRYTWRDFFIAALSVMLIVASLAWCSQAHAMTPHQRWALNYALKAGSPFGITLAAIVWQESSLCAHKRGLDRHSYGCGQIRASTARDALHVKVSIKTLKTNDRLNIQLSSDYLMFCINATGDWSRAVYCYNHGPSAAQNAKKHAILRDKYVRHIQARMIEVKVYLKKQLNGALTPADDFAIEMLKQIKHDEVVSADITKPRNLKFLRKYFALLGVAYDNQEQYANFDDFRSEVIIQSGFYTTLKHLDGTMSKQAKSISFARMDELEFSQLYQRTLDALISKFLPGTDPNELARQADEILGFS